ncbi:phosphate-induced protein 1 conserved region-domain-containing protein [Zopfochytrium polystomum]|nr:phosphate-induced protein 1 conserved region-domain-containing protein [Zopfochytrium polystomum]
MKVLITAVLALSTTSWLSAVVAAAPFQQQAAVLPQKKIMKLIGDEDDSSPKQAATPVVPIQYNGGSVMTEPLHIYFILYGNHDAQVAQNFQYFAEGLHGSDWWGVTRTYYQPINGTNVPISDRVVFKDIWYDNYSLGKDISADSAIPTIITNAIHSHRGYEDENAIYVLYMSADVTDGGFCTGGYCGYHWYFTTPNNKRLVYALIGDPTVCPGSLPPPGQPKGVPGCLPRPWRNTTTSINGNQHADGPMSAIAHEITEAASDRFGDAWFDADGEENGDKCNGNYLGLQFQGSEGYNVDFNGHLFLIQSNWDVITQSCSIGRKQHVHTQ